MSFTIEQLTTGQTASFRKTITEADVINFASASGDMNPVHIDKIAGKDSIFGDRVAHGILVSGLISTVLGNQLPGNGTIYLGQDMRFTHPTYIGDTITATVQVTEINKEKNRVRLQTTCTNQDGVVVITGTATAMPPKA
ncbi:enoyl-CoA hydratase [Enterobacter sp. CGMCC 5087]|uniref:MaoC family dehydratase n=1 Tax=Enterobacter sp. CGMCC 5087 TaxID=2183878 RepID=UPI000D67CB75|nr:MaoC family dehydratase [Enterobacter sp. CGMCC 5087]PWI77172.1 enoyl-CoA hydratase [Enterobacter sp. CGMCC 5087]